MYSSDRRYTAGEQSGNAAQNIFLGTVSVNYLGSSMPDYPDQLQKDAQCSSFSFIDDGNVDTSIAEILLQFTEVEQDYCQRYVRIVCQFPGKGVQLDFCTSPQIA
jgi:hypothetical protein